MKKSSKKNREIILGRADILLKFLQLIGKDKPSDLDHYLEDLDPELDRPMVDQIVDKFIEGNEELNEIYQKSRREVGSRNPYSEAGDIKDIQDYQEALGNFITEWTKFEKTMRKLFQNETAYRKFYSIGQMLTKLTLPEDFERQILKLSSIRNKIVHGIEMPDTSYLEEISESVKKLQNELKKWDKK